jgi:hypothetical protein
MIRNRFNGTGISGFVAGEPRDHFTKNNGSTVINGRTKTSATDFANLHEFSKPFARIRVIRGKESVPHGPVPPETGEPKQLDDFIKLSSQAVPTGFEPAMI